MTQALDRLLAGNRRYRDGLNAAERRKNEALANKGQAPDTLVIGCCDSRVPLEELTDSHPGDMFVLRSIAALVPPYHASQVDSTAAAVEYAVKHLHVTDIIVCGHCDCGGVAAVRESSTGPAQDTLLPSWLDVMRQSERGPAIARSQSMKAAEYETVRLALDNLATYPFVADAVEAGKLSLAGCHIDSATGRLDVVTTWATPA